MTNLVTQSIPAAKIAAALQALRDARAQVAEYLHALTPDQRKEMPKMGSKSLEFVTEAATYGTSLTALIPGYIDVNGLVVDASVSRDLFLLAEEAEAFALDLDSTRMVAGSEGYKTALSVYSALQVAAKNNQPAAQAAVASLEPRFARPAAIKATKAAAQAV